jgi:hemerythrin-like domain-containing protein
MFYSRQVSHRLHEEHLATIQLWGRLEQSIAARVPEAELETQLRNCAAALADEVTRHFGFEEQELFTRLAQAGDGDIAELLTEEHGTIREIARQLDGLLARPERDAAAWQQLRTLGLELAERLTAHVQKEEMALLPALEDLIDEETDRELVLAYASS